MAVKKSFGPLPSRDFHFFPPYNFPHHISFSSQTEIPTPISDHRLRAFKISTKGASALALQEARPADILEQIDGNQQGLVIFSRTSRGNLCGEVRFDVSSRLDFLILSALSDLSIMSRSCVNSGALREAIRSSTPFECTSEANRGRPMKSGLGRPAQLYS